MDNAETRKEKVNEYAEKLYQLRAQAGSKEEQKNLFSKLCEAVIQDIPMLMKKYYPVKEDEVWDIVIDLLYYEFPPDMREKWKPDLGPFMGCFRFLCKTRLKGYLKEHSASATDDEDGTTQLKKAPVQRVQPKIDSETGEENDLLGKIADNSQQVEAEFQVSMTMKHIISLMNDEVQFKMKASPNKFCYTQRFYTEWIARQILEPEIGNILSLLSAVPEKCVDLLFASSFLDHEVNAISEIYYCDLKMLSEFTNKEKDKSTPCGFDLKNIVYVNYIKQVKGKDVSDSQVSNQRKNYYELLKMQAGKIGIGNHPIAES